MTEAEAIVHVEPRAMAAPETSAIERETGSILEVIARAAADPTVDVAKLERLLAIQQTILADQRRTSYMAALARLQATLPQIAKSGQILDREGGLRNKYARIEDIDAKIRPLCAAEGFSFSFDSKPAQGGTAYECAMHHRDGHTEVKTLVMPTDKGAGRNAVQDVGSTTSYARRYLLGMHLHLITRGEDDDGNGPPAPITAVHLAELRAALVEVGGTEERFLKWAGVETWEALTEAHYTRGMKYMDEKRRQRASGAGK